MGWGELLRCKIWGQGVFTLLVVQANTIFEMLGGEIKSRLHYRVCVALKVFDHSLLLGGCCCYCAAAAGLCHSHSSLP